MQPDEVHVMLDLETLATVPWSCILSVGAVAFTPSGKVVAEFYSNVEPSTCIDIGLIADPKTAQWWAHPDRAEARRAFSTDKKPIGEVIDAFGDWFRTSGAVKVWAHGATFDIPIWDTACSFAKKSTPWIFRNVRDTRTVFDLVDVEFSALKKEGAYHNALDDARNQVTALVDAFRKLKVIE